MLEIFGDGLCEPVNPGGTATQEIFPESKGQAGDIAAETLGISELPLHTVRIV